MRRTALAQRRQTLLDHLGVASFVPCLLVNPHAIVEHGNVPLGAGGGVPPAVGREGDEAKALVRGHVVNGEHDAAVAQVDDLQRRCPAGGPQQRLAAGKDGIPERGAILAVLGGYPLRRDGAGGRIDEAALAI